MGGARRRFASAESRRRCRRHLAVRPDEVRRESRQRSANTARRARTCAVLRLRPRLSISLRSSSVSSTFTAIFAILLGGSSQILYEFLDQASSRVWYPSLYRHSVSLRCRWKVRPGRPLNFASQSLASPRKPPLDGSELVPGMVARAVGVDDGVRVPGSTRPRLCGVGLERQSRCRLGSCVRRY